LNIQFHKFAVEETAAAVDWYRDRSPAAADGFMRELNTLLAQVVSSPAIFARADPGYRRAVFRHYPFSIVYTERQNQIYVIAVAHAKRRPGYWRNRQKT
jgi:plasmid stabilization system protein ParE